MTGFSAPTRCVRSSAALVRAAAASAVLVLASAF